MAQPKIIQSPDEITTEWLGEVLDAEIKNLSMRENPAFNSSVTHLELTYASEVTLPRHVLVKLNKEHDGQNEVQFYRFVKNMELSMIPQLLGVDYNPQSGLSYLLLEDISNTHSQSVTIKQLKTLQGIPSQEQIETIVDAIAQFHATFWEHPLLGSIPETTEMRWWYRDEESHTKHVERRTVEWKKFLEMHAVEVPGEWIAVGESSLKRLNILFETRIKPRLNSKSALTMSQGDCYLTQFLVPYAGSGKAYLVDFQDASVNFPTYDLVYMFATFWSREQRAQNEKNMLERYQDGLEKLGVKYDWESLKNDYRLCISYMLFDAIWNATSGSSSEYWRPKLQCLIEAYQDWDCANL